MDDDDGCFVTVDDAHDRLLGIEQRLAARYGIRQNFRRALLALDRAGKLVEDELVADWHDAYDAFCSYLDDAHEPTREEACNPAPALDDTKAEDPNPPPDKESELGPRQKRENEAAKAASVLFVDSYCRPHRVAPCPSSLRSDDTASASVLASSSA